MTLLRTWQPTASKQVCEHDLKLPGLLDPLDHLLSVSQNQLNEVSARNQGNRRYSTCERET